MSPVSSSNKALCTLAASHRSVNSDQTQDYGDPRQWCKPGGCAVDDAVNGQRLIAGVDLRQRLSPELDQAGMIRVETASPVAVRADICSDVPGS